MEVIVYVIIFLVAGGLGLAIGYFMSQSKIGLSLAVAVERKQSLESQLKQNQLEVEQWMAKFNEANFSLSSTQNEVKNLQLRLSEQKEQLSTMQEQMQKDFSLLANKILEENSKKIVEKNDLQLKGILEPLKERLVEYEKKVVDTQRHTDQERSAMKEQLRMMTEMNKRMSDEALNLTKALKGDAKTQGNWGELILEKILEKSGLTKGTEYSVQQSFTNEDGQRSMPDVLINLPDNKHLVIDSKVSLVAYERYVASDDDLERAQFLKEHQLSLRAHVKGLSAKAYHQIYAINSPDFVLLFVPIESAFAAAIKDNEDLYNEAFDKNIIIVSTSTLLATLRTISNIWKQENQSKNALEIARQGADLYDKFSAFTEDLVKLGVKLNAAKGDYEEAMKKLSSGTGNLIRRTENMKKLGLKTSKSIQQNLLDRAENDT